MWYEGFCSKQNFRFVDYFAILEGETCLHHPGGKKKKKNWEWDLQVDYVF